jgi:Family of unknown function (DUF6529)
VRFGSQIDFRALPSGAFSTSSRGDLEDFVEGLTRGNVSQVKTVLATIVMALAGYQVFLMAVGYGKLKLSFLKGKAASFTHRAVGDTIVLITLLVAYMCV